MSLNRFIALGRLTKDNDLTQTQQGVSILRNSIAINEKYKDRESAVFIDIIAFGKLAEIICEYTLKGFRIAIEGRLSQERWETNGVKHQKHGIIVEKVNFIDYIDDGKDNRDISDNTQNASTARTPIIDARSNEPIITEADIPF